MHASADIHICIRFQQILTPKTGTGIRFQQILTPKIRNRYLGEYPSGQSLEASNAAHSATIIKNFHC